MIAVGARHRLAPVRADEMRKSETQAELRGERAAVVRGAEQPRLGRGVALGLRPDPGERMPRGQRAVEEADQVLYLLRQALRALEFAVPPPERPSRVPAGPAAPAHIDASAQRRPP